MQRMQRIDRIDRIDRLDRLDALRGAAMVWMTIYHFCFDLTQYRWITQDFYRDPVWTWQRTAILSLFLLCAGAGQAVALHFQQDRLKFWRRWSVIVACALLVSAGSYWMFPGSFIYFGVLHGMAVMLIIVRWTAHWGRWLWLCGAVAVALHFIAPELIQVNPNIAFLDDKAFNWLGLISAKPVTEDYVPLLPWLGVTWWGVAAAQFLLKHHRGHLTAPLSVPLHWLAWLGTWSLVYYMAHQSLLIGALELAQKFR